MNVKMFNETWFSDFNRYKEFPKNRYEKINKEILYVWNDVNKKKGKIKNMFSFYLKKIYIYINIETFKKIIN